MTKRAQRIIISPEQEARDEYLSALATYREVRHAPGSEDEAIRAVRAVMDRAYDLYVKTCHPRRAT
jgi:hypothetical protein